MQTALLREILSHPRYHVLHFDLRIAGFADLESPYTSLSIQMEGYFEELATKGGWYEEDSTEPVASVKEIPAGDPTARRTFFADTGRRKEIFFGPEVRRHYALHIAIADFYARISSQATSVMATSPSLPASH